MGCVTASRISDVLAKGRSGAPSASRNAYMAQLICERMTGLPQEQFTNDAMRWGTEQEPHARSLYEIASGTLVQVCGFIRHPRIAYAGASPDGLIGDDGLLEIKAPTTATHIEYLIGRKPPAKYLPQMAWQCICTGRAWCNFVSFDPRMPERLQLFIAHYEPPRDYLREVEAEVAAFLEEVKEKVEFLSQLAS